jgi:hypothetical protein
VPSRKKVNLEKVFASLNTVCPRCGKVILPLKSAESVSMRLSALSAVRNSHPIEARQIIKRRILSVIVILQQLG